MSQTELVGSDRAYKPPLKLDVGNAGNKVEAPVPDEKKLKTVVYATSARYGGPRSDPFALTYPEKAFEVQQSSARVFTNLGDFQTFFTPPQEAATAPAPIIEAQPYRRLSGIIVGDSVLAIIELGNGQTEIIRPGMTIPNTPWKVKSIDANKAVLVRGGNVEPKQIVVRLETPPPGMRPPTNPGGLRGGTPGGFPGGPPGGFPGGGPPGGFPGGYPGGFPGGPPGGRGD